MPVHSRQLKVGISGEADLQLLYVEPQVVGASKKGTGNFGTPLHLSSEDISGFKNSS